MIVVTAAQLLGWLLMAVFAAFALGIALGSAIGRRQARPQTDFYRRSAQQWFDTWREQRDAADWWKQN